MFLPCPVVFFLFLFPFPWEEVFLSESSVSPHSDRKCQTPLVPLPKEKYQKGTNVRGRCLFSSLSCVTNGFKLCCRETWSRC